MSKSNNKKGEVKPNTTNTQDNTSNSNNYYSASSGTPYKAGVEDNVKKKHNVKLAVIISVGVFAVLMIIGIVSGGSGDHADLYETTTKATNVYAAVTYTSKATTETTTIATTIATTETTTKVTTTKVASATTAESKGETYILNKNSGVYHKSSCSTIKDSDNTTVINAEQAKNYRPCKRCFK